MGKKINSTVSGGELEIRITKAQSFHDEYY